MIDEVDVRSPHTLADYEQDPVLHPEVSELRSHAARCVPRIGGRTIWMVNSTARGGGVAEMLPKLVWLMRELGVDVRWCTVNTPHADFFALTKRIHNAIHGAPGATFSAADRDLYERVSDELCAELLPRMRTGDVVVVHDPQPAGMGARVRRAMDVRAIWRCHIGLAETTPSGDAAWEFLRPELEGYDHQVFSDRAYVPAFSGKPTTIIRPSIDPLSHKNRPLRVVKLVGVLSNAGLVDPQGPVLTAGFEPPVARLGDDGQFVPLRQGSDIGLLFRPVVTQISRWDRLKGWSPLLEGFRRMKNGLAQLAAGRTERQRRRLELTRLILAGPDPESVQDDPEALAVLDEIRDAYVALPAERRRQVAVLSLPMRSHKHNALIVNALQRASSVVVQNSLQEGFGLVVTEPMWKGTPVLGSSAYGIRQQIQPGVHGGRIDDPSDPESVRRSLVSTLDDLAGRDRMAQNAQFRVQKEFLLFRHIRDWLSVLSQPVAGP